MLEKIQGLLLNKWKQYELGCGQPDSLCLSAFSKDQADGKIFIYVFKNNESFPSLVVKTRKDKDGINYFQRQYDNLCHIHSNPDLAVFTQYAPRPVMCDKVSGQFVYSETFLGGCQLKNITSSRLQIKYLLRSVEWLNRFHKATCRLEECSDEKLKKEVFLPDAYLEKIEECALSIGQIEEYISGALKKRSSKLFPFVFYHGDFSSYNILAAKNDIGIIDWEYSSLKGAPVLDLLNLLAYFGYKKFKGSFYKSFLWAFSQDGNFSKLCKELTGRYNNELKIDTCLTELFVLRFLLELIFLKDKEREDIVMLINLLLKRAIKLNVSA